MHTPVYYLRRKAASEYLLTKYGFGGGSTLSAPKLEGFSLRAIMQIGARNMSGTARGALMHTAQYLRRQAAGEYLLTKYGFGGGSTLTNLACVGGGPPFHKAGRALLYTIEALDTWARARIGAAQRSTSDREGRS